MTNETRALIEAAEAFLESRTYQNGYALEAAISSAKAAEGVEKDWINRLINAKHSMDTKAIDEGDFSGFAEEIADEIISVRKKEGL